MERKYVVLDVFAERAFEGNPLTVVLDGADLSERAMQAMARETNHSETTFVTGPPKDGAWPVRIFTPARELPFAGHPTLGTAAAIAGHLGGKSPVTLDLKVGRVTVAQRDGLWWLTAPSATLGNMVQPAFAARSVNLSPLDLDARAMPQVASTGVPFLIVPVERLARARVARFELSRLQELAPRAGAEAVLLICPETESKDTQLHARAFTEAFGIPEDPATGSAAAALGAWLVSSQYLGSDSVDIVVEQGIEIGRPSRLHVRARPGASAAHVAVGGRVVPVAKGEFH